jgi:hypothetical protein
MGTLDFAGFTYLSFTVSSCITLCPVSPLPCCLSQIHGRSRFPGLSVWLADGTRSLVAIPPGCLLCQVGGV